MRIREGAALPEFILAFINSSQGQAYFRSKAKRTTNLASINSTEVSNLPLPLPDKKVQAAVVRDLERTAQKAKSMRDSAAKKRTEAWTNFISAIFS